MMTATQDWREMGIPTNDDQAMAFAESLRAEFVKSHGEDLTDWCHIISALVYRNYRDQGAEEWMGAYDCNPEQMHVVARVGDYLIDVSADQFPDGYEIACPKVAELDEWYEYKTFRLVPPTK
jgi:hypothetical protein